MQSSNLFFLPHLFPILYGNHHDSHWHAPILLNGVHINNIIQCIAMTTMLLPSPRVVLFWRQLQASIQIIINSDLGRPNPELFQNRELDLILYKFRPIWTLPLRYITSANAFPFFWQLLPLVAVNLPEELQAYVLKGECFESTEVRFQASLIRPGHDTESDKSNLRLWKDCHPSIRGVKITCRFCLSATLYNDGRDWH